MCIRDSLRTVTGAFKGTAKPVATYGSQSVSGGEIQVTLGIAAVKQVVWVNWMPTYRDSLENMGLRAADQRIRERIIEAMQAPYIGVNLEFRTEEPRDFKLYARVDLEGPDPNGLGLLGYDNTAGKDKGNDRLEDRIGGVNAVTQEGGYPGYGGVFIDSLFGFSTRKLSLWLRPMGSRPSSSEPSRATTPLTSGTRSMIAFCTARSVAALCSRLIDGSFSSCMMMSPSSRAGMNDLPSCVKRAPAATTSPGWNQTRVTVPVWRGRGGGAVSFTQLRAHQTRLDLVCRLLLEKKNNTSKWRVCTLAIMNST